MAFDDLKTLEDVQRFLAERRKVMPHSTWTELVREVAEEMAGRAQLPTDQIMQRIGVFKRATDTLPPLQPKSQKARETGWLVLDGGTSQSPQGNSTTGSESPGGETEA